QRRRPARRTGLIKRVHHRSSRTVIARRSRSNPGPPPPYDHGLLRRFAPRNDDRDPLSKPHCSQLTKLLDAPDVEIALLIIIARDEGILVAALGMNVFLGHQEWRLHESALRLAMERAVELVDRLPRLQFDRLADGDRLILIALADAIVGRAIPVGPDQLRLVCLDAAGAQHRHGEIPVVVADRSRVDWQPEALN